MSIKTFVFSAILFASSVALAPWAVAQAPSPSGTAKATFAGGCFWCVEYDFDKVDGVISTTSGYIGGKTANPTYEQVAAKATGHYEAVEIVFDPKKVSYEKLLEYFWRTIDPTDKDGQFCDKGGPYKTAIFMHDAAQQKAAQNSRDALEKNKPFKAPVVTELLPATTFYPAETYHQDYYKKNPVRYKYYRTSCGRDARVKELWGAQAGQLPAK
ncbi:MAG: peptide-methionine (S)-S-oxide reductase [Betaproteobacteria bacterium]|nr:MAG: peptide-methionine (S)-S-oxide reductase [Betaproteobacteria bacterium]TAG47686.1 MAG: peptide-methionine (S)-S-oxide reductase [Betaproteobacteria bacterium]